MKFFIVRYSHRFGDDVWPVWQNEQPTLLSLLEKEVGFAEDWEGEDPRFPENHDYRHDEFIEVYGPFEVPNASKRSKKSQKHSK